MKLDFPSFGGAALPIPRRLIERRMRQLDVRPIDDVRGPLRIGLIAAALFFGLFGLFAILAPIAGAAIATGTVAVSGAKLLIQPVASGLVSDLLVQEGQQVRQGQPLVRLNGIRSGASLRQAQARVDMLRATEARLIAERDGLDGLMFPRDLAARSAEPEVAEAMRSQRAIFERHRSVLAADRGISDAQLDAAKAKQAAAARQLALINDELDGMLQLYRKGYARKTTVRSLQRAAAQLDADRLTGLASIQEAELSSRKVRDGQVMETVSQLNQVQEQLAQVRPQLDVTRYMADRDVLRAPATGRVSNVAAVGPGTVVSGGRTLMELIPTGRTLLIDVRIRPEDADDVHVGSKATVRFTSVNPHGRTSFDGHVVTLSPTSIAGENGQAFFKAQIAIDDPALVAKSGVTLEPGFPASANIATEKRTLANYLLRPFMDALSHAFREE